MSITLKLDTAALLTLFPEGSQAHLDLQQCVIQQLINRRFRPSDALQLGIDKATSEFHTLCANVYTAHFDNCVDAQLAPGSRATSWGVPKRTLGPEVVDLIQQQAAKDAREAIESLVKVTAESMTTNAIQRCEAELAKVLSQIPTAATAAVEEAFKQRLDAIFNSLSKS